MLRPGIIDIGVIITYPANLNKQKITIQLEASSGFVDREWRYWGWSEMLTPVIVS